MRRAWWILGLVAALAGCESDDLIFVPDGEPAAPRAVSAYYYAGAVNVTWELAPQWNGEAFRVYSRRLEDSDYFLIAEVTSCADGVCVYQDRNVAEGRTYLYYVAAVDPDSGVETANDTDVEVTVPSFQAPPAPGGVQVVALDGANYVRWADGSRSAADFAFYRVYFESDDGDAFLLGETDSEGFLDQLAENGSTYGYFVSAVDEFGHESGGSGLAVGTPRPDYHGEFVYAFSDLPSLAGFRFQADETSDPVTSGSDPARHFRLEVNGSGWWLVPGSGTSIYPQGFATTALKCGVAADASCVDVPSAPTSGYVSSDVGLATQTSYVLRVRGDDGQTRYGVIRVELLGFDQDNDALMIFDWAYQTQAGNPDLTPGR